MKKIILIIFLIFFYFGNYSIAEEVCESIIDVAYPEVLQEFPNTHFYVVVGSDGRCEYGRGPDEDSGFSNCEKWKKK